MNSDERERLESVYEGLSLDGISDDLLQLLPRHKLDVERVEQVIALGHPNVDPVLAHLLTWLRDLNWPVGSALSSFLAERGHGLVPELDKILATDDEMWKMWVLRAVVAEMSAEVIGELSDSIAAIAAAEVGDDDDEDLQEIARSLLERLSF